MKVHIIGGGIIGLCTAYYLQQEGAEVVLVDKDDWKDGCSHGNAGMIVPSHFIPLAAPGVMAQGIRWMFSNSSPFYIRPRLDLSLIQWIWQFYRSCRPEKVERAIPVLRDFNWLSQQLYKELNTNPELEFAYEDKGLLMLCQKKSTFEEEVRHAEKAVELGLKAEVFSASQIHQVEQNLPTNAEGAVYYPGDAHLHPNQLMEQLRKYLLQQGVQFIPSTYITGFAERGGSISHIKTQKGERIEVEQLVLAAGSWSARVLKALQLKMLLQDGKGYSLTLQNPDRRPSVPTILTEAKVAVTPMGTDLRIGGTLEISNLDPSINMSRLRGIVASMPRYYPDFEIETPPQQAVWHGFRPCTPDGLPYIGRMPGFTNLTVATGHAMMGLSLGPASGKLVAEIICNKKTSLEIKLFNPGRF
ncbi:MAG: FAD-dependent oxidoreductase [Bacteroidota bacterium]